MSEKLLLLVLAYCLFKGIDILIVRTFKLIKNIFMLVDRREK